MLKNRPLAGCILAISIGIGTGIYLDGKIRAAVFALFGVLCGLALAAHYFFHKKTKGVFLFSLFAIAGLAYVAAYSAVVFSGYALYNGKTDTVTATVNDVGRYADGGYFDITIRESRIGLGRGTGVRLYYAGKIADNNTGREADVRRGDTLICDVQYKTHQNGGLFAKSIALTAQGSVERAAAGSGFFYNLRADAEKLTDRLFADYPKEVASVAKTLIVGENTDTDSYVYGLFRNAGLSHLLVISGLHITIVVMSLYSLLEFLTVRRQVRSVVCMVVLVAYAAFVGFSPSVLRAAVMTGVTLLLSLFLRRTDSVTSLFLALMLLLIVNPYNLASVSLELSFLSCLGILILSPYLMRPVAGKHAKIKKAALALASPLIYAFAAAVFTFPVSLVFDTVSYITPVANLFITPLYTYLLILLIPSLILYAVISSGAAAFAFIPGVIMEYSVLLLKKIYQAGIGSFSTHIPLMSLPLGFSIAAILSLCLLRRKKMFVAAGVLSVCFVASTAFCIISFNVQSKKASLAAVQDGWLYKSLFIADGNENLYIELGGRKSGVKTIFAHGYSRLDGYVMNGVTEADFQKLADALSQINVRTVYVPAAQGSVERDKMIEKIKVLAKDRGCDIISYNMAIYKNTGDSAVEIIRGGENALADSVVVKVRRDGRTVRVYGGEKTKNPNDYQACDAAVMLEGFADPYAVPCLERCVKVGKNDHPGDDAGRIHDYSQTDYVRVAIREGAVEVSTDEP